MAKENMSMCFGKLRIERHQHCGLQVLITIDTAADSQQFLGHINGGYDYSMSSQSE